MILGDLSHIGAVEIGDRDLSAFSLSDHIGNFRIVDSLLSGEMEDGLIGDPVDHISKVLELAVKLFSREVFLLHQIDEMKFQLEIEAIPIEGCLSCKEDLSA